MHALIFGFLFVVGAGIAICALPFIGAALALFWIALPWLIGLVDGIILFATMFGHPDDRTPGYVISGILTVWVSIWLSLREERGLFFDKFI